MSEVQVVGRKRLVALVGRRFHRVSRVAPDLEGILRPLLIELVVVNQARPGYGADELPDHRVDVGAVVRKPFQERVGIVGPRVVPQPDLRRLAKVLVQPLEALAVLLLWIDDVGEVLGAALVEPLGRMRVVEVAVVDPAHRVRHFVRHGRANARRPRERLRRQIQHLGREVEDTADDRSLVLGILGEHLPDHPHPKRSLRCGANTIENRP